MLRLAIGPKTCFIPDLFCWKASLDMMEFAPSPEKPPSDVGMASESGLGDEMASESDAMTKYSELKLTNRERGLWGCIRRYQALLDHPFPFVCFRWSLDYNKIFGVLKQVGPLGMKLFEALEGLGNTSMVISLPNQPGKKISHVYSGRWYLRSHQWHISWPIRCHLACQVSRPCC